MHDQKRTDKCVGGREASNGFSVGHEVERREPEVKREREGKHIARQGPDCWVLANRGNMKHQDLSDPDVHLEAVSSETWQLVAVPHDEVRKRKETPMPRCNLSPLHRVATTVLLETVSSETWQLVTVPHEEVQLGTPAPIACIPAEGKGIRQSDVHLDFHLQG
ncbi:hypothetical protein JB92DRAFT_2838666 [Gautieria morchelliformis]|nr:hypothetical protein JB92DRAFT_2838666 [Gautieria morchelliformis]